MKAIDLNSQHTFELGSSPKIRAAHPRTTGRLYAKWEIINDKLVCKWLID